MISIFFYPLKNLKILRHNYFWLYALVGGITNIAYALAVIEGHLIRVMLLFFLSPVWTIPLAYFILKEAIKLRHTLAAFLCIIGACIILWHPNILDTGLGLGDIYGIIGGIGFALTNVLARLLSSFSVKEKSYAIWIGVVLMALITILFVPFSFNLDSINFSSFSLILMVGFILLLATLIIQHGLRLVDAVRAGPIFLFEIIIVAVSGYVLVNEVIFMKDFFGGLLIMSGIFISGRK